MDSGHRVIPVPLVAPVEMVADVEAVVEAAAPVETSAIVKSARPAIAIGSSPRLQPVVSTIGSVMRSEFYAIALAMGIGRCLEGGRAFGRIANACPMLHDQIHCNTFVVPSPCSKN